MFSIGVSVGIILALVAMLCWGFGDFLIQKSARKFGDWESLFIITAFGAVILLPFVYQDIHSLFSFTNPLLWILLGGSIVLFIAALVDFEALREGKLSVVEPIWATEIPVGVILAFIIMNESMSPFQIILIILLVTGLFLVSLKKAHLNSKVWLEKGVILAFIAAIMMGTANFFLGWGSRESDALMANWFMNSFMALGCLIYIVAKGRLNKSWRDIKNNKSLLLGMSLFDNSAWIAFAFAMTLTQIGIAVALSECYIIITVLLGLYSNKERLAFHQIIGLILAIISAIVLTSVASY